MNHVSIIGFRSRLGDLPRPHLAVAVANRTGAKGRKAVEDLQAASPVGPLRVPCLQDESPEALRALLLSLGACVLSLNP